MEKHEDGTNHEHHAGHSPAMFRQRFGLTLALAKLIPDKALIISNELSEDQLLRRIGLAG